MNAAAKGICTKHGCFTVFMEDDSLNRLSPNSVARRVGALQDLAALLDYTGINSNVVLPVNAESAGQVVLPVSDGQIDLALSMVLPDFLQEILARLDKILSTDGSIVINTESQPKVTESQGNITESQSDIPESQGYFSESQDDITTSQGDIKESQGDIPESLGDFPEPQDDIIEPQSNIPESQGDIKESQGDIKESQGDFPEPQDDIIEPQSDIPESQEDIPESQSGIPESQGDIIDSQGDIPESRVDTTEGPLGSTPKIGAELQKSPQAPVMEDQPKVGKPKRPPRPTALPSFDHGKLPSQNLQLMDLARSDGAIVETSPINTEGSDNASNSLVEAGGYIDKRRLQEPHENDLFSAVNFPEERRKKTPEGNDAQHDTEPITLTLSSPMTPPISDHTLIAMKECDGDKDKNPLTPQPTPPPRPKKHHRAKQHEHKAPLLMPEDYRQDFMEQSDEFHEGEFKEDESQKSLPQSSVESPYYMHDKDELDQHQEVEITPDNDESTFGKPTTGQQRSLDPIERDHSDDGVDHAAAPMQTDVDLGEHIFVSPPAAVSIQSMLDQIDFLGDSSYNTQYLDEPSEDVEQPNIEEGHQEILATGPTRPVRPHHLPLFEQVEKEHQYTNDDDIKGSEEDSLKRHAPLSPEPPAAQEVIGTKEDNEHNELNQSDSQVPAQRPARPMPPLPSITRQPDQDFQYYKQVDQERQKLSTEESPKPKRPPRPIVQPSLDQKEHLGEFPKPTSPPRRQLPHPPTIIRPACSMPALNIEPQLKGGSGQPKRLPPPRPPIRLASSMMSLDHRSSDEEATQPKKETSHAFNKPKKPPRPSAQPSLDHLQTMLGPHKIDDIAAEPKYLTKANLGSKYSSNNSLDSQYSSALFHTVTPTPDRPPPPLTPPRHRMPPPLPPPPSLAAYVPPHDNDEKKYSFLQESSTESEHDASPGTPANEAHSHLNEEMAPIRPPPPNMTPLIDLRSHGERHTHSDTSLVNKESPTGNDSLINFLDNDGQGGYEEESQHSLLANIKTNLKRQVHVNDSIPNESLSDSTSASPKALVLPQDQFTTQRAPGDVKLKADEGLEDKGDIWSNNSEGVDDDKRNEEENQRDTYSASADHNNKAKVEMFASDIASDIVESSLINFPVETGEAPDSTSMYPRNDILGSDTVTEAGGVSLYQIQPVEKKQKTPHKHEDFKLAKPERPKENPKRMPIPIHQPGPVVDAMSYGGDVQKTLSQAAIPSQTDVLPLTIDPATKDKAAPNEDQLAVGRNSSRALLPSRSVSSNFVWEHDDMNIAVSVSSLEQVEVQNRNKKMKIAIDYDVKEHDTVVSNGTFNVEVKIPTSRTLSK